MEGDREGVEGGSAGVVKRSVSDQVEGRVERTQDRVQAFSCLLVREAAICPGHFRDLAFIDLITLSEQITWRISGESS